MLIEVIYYTLTSNNLYAIQIFLNRGIDVNYCFQGVSLLLLTLLHNGVNEISDFLLSQGAKIIDDGEFVVCEDLMLHKLNNRGLTKAMELGYSPLKRDENGSNYLHSACQNNDLNIVQQLLQSKYKDELLHEKNKDKRTPFTCVATNDILEEVIDAMLNAGANINDQDADGNTALLRSCITMSDDDFNILMDRNADVNIADNNGRVR